MDELARRTFVGAPAQAPIHLPSLVRTAVRLAGLAIALLVALLLSTGGRVLLDGLLPEARSTQQAQRANDTGPAHDVPAPRGTTGF